jgi:Glyoxalase/Bleomycin resistance protein/Dioxygenase superfamily
MVTTRSANKYGLEFHHLGLAVDSPDAAVAFLGALGYSTGETLLDPLQNVYLMMCDHPVMPSIEVIYPAPGEGPLDKLLVEHKEGLVYHMCYTTADLRSTLSAMDDKEGPRIFCVSPPKAAVLFGGKAVSFYKVAGIGLIEIIEERR